jgi:hypothetical protein
VGRLCSKTCDRFPLNLTYTKIVRLCSAPLTVCGNQLVAVAGLLQGNKQVHNGITFTDRQTDRSRRSAGKRLSTDCAEATGSDKGCRLLCVISAGKARPACKADNLTATCDPVV